MAVGLDLHDVTARRRLQGEMAILTGVGKGIGAGNGHLGHQQRLAIGAGDDAGQPGQCRRLFRGGLRGLRRGRLRAGTGRRQRHGIGGQGDADGGSEQHQGESGSDHGRACTETAQRLPSQSGKGKCIDRPGTSRAQPASPGAEAYDRKVAVS